jgi:hypothetical protein
MLRPLYIVFGPFYVANFGGVMNRLSALVFGLMLAGVATVPELAHAGKPAAASDADKYKIPEMKPTKIAEYDSTFQQAVEPITSVVNARKMVDAAQARFTTSMGLAADVTFADALTQLKNRGEGKINIAVKTGKFPTLSTSDVVPPDVQHAIDEFNGSVADLETAFNQLGNVQPQLVDLATKVTSFNPAEAAKSSGLSATDTITAGKNTASNGKALSQAKDDAEKLVTSLNGMALAVESTFAAP